MRFARRLTSAEASWVLDREPVAVIVTGLDLEVRYANAAARMLAYRAGGRLVTGAQVPPLGSPSLATAAEDTVAHGVLVRRELRFDNGRTYLVEGIADRHRRLAVLCLDDATDGTRRLEAERDFVVNAVHEFLTPLTAISGAAYALQAGAKDDPAERDRFIGHLVEAADQLTAVSRALLVLARAEAGVHPPRLEPLALRPFLDEVVRSGGSSALAILCPAHATVFVDRDLLWLALKTLLENVGRYSAERPGEVVVDEVGDNRIEIAIGESAAEGEPNDGMVQRFVTGEGRDSRGFGLGLSIASRAVRLVDGTLTLSSGSQSGVVRIVVPSAAEVRP
jgi:signal transduction histidine kinase